MMRADDPELERVQDAVRSIGRHARRENLHRVARLSEALEAAAAGGLAAAGRADATTLAHQLVGSAGTFGYLDTSEWAGEVERFFAEGGFDDPAAIAVARTHLRLMHQDLTDGHGFSAQEWLEPLGTDTDEAGAADQSGQRVLNARVDAG